MIERSKTAREELHTVQWPCTGPILHTSLAVLLNGSKTSE